MTMPDTKAIREKTKALTGFTPGPWIYYADLPGVEPNWHIVTTDNKMRVLANVHIEPGNAMDVANARLIAAAPDMRETILALCDALDDLRNALDFVRSENERLYRAWNAMHDQKVKMSKDHADYHHKSQLRMHELKTENARLRAALQKISAGEGYYGEQAREYKDIARATLAQKGCE